MKKLMLVLLVAVFVFPVSGMAKKNHDILGVYSVTGFNPGVQTSSDPSYTGELEISQSGGAYLLNWQVGEKAKEYKGVGIYTNGVLSVGYNGGVVSYKVEKNTLKGVWAPAKGGIFGYEICQKK